jgi:TetR/AcrR family transcriptional repressor of nem operon
MIVPTSVPKAAPKTNTADEILDTAEFLIQTRGYSAISYQDIADRLGLRKASIHYHFPSKTDLGLAVVDRYGSRFEQALDAAAADRTLGTAELFDSYTVPYLEFAASPDRICLCGALAGEILALPQPMRDRVQRNYIAQQEWLAAMLKRGQKAGDIEIGPTSPAKMARAILSALQGALLVKRATGNASQVRDVISVIKAQLIPGRKSR